MWPRKSRAYVEQLAYRRDWLLYPFWRWRNMLFVGAWRRTLRRSFKRVRPFFPSTETLNRYQLSELLFRLSVASLCLPERKQQTGATLVVVPGGLRVTNWEIEDKELRKEQMGEHAVRTKKALVVGLKSCVCALPLTHVIETMRPLPVEPISGVPSFVLGISIIRGIPTPVIDLEGVVCSPSERAERFVTLRVGDKQVALSVNAVIGIRDLAEAVMMEALPPLLQRASEDAIETIGTLDQQVLLVLREGWELPDEIWQALTTQEAV